VTDRVENLVRWGVLATGGIAEKFATDLALVPDQSLAAVASRRQESADEFATRFGADHAHGSYQALLEDPDVDVVYVATPHGRHLEDVEACLAAGKHVLCEKPLTLDAADARRLVDDARSRGLFLAEAMWMRANPAIRGAVDAARSGACGTLGSVRADLGFVAPKDKARLWDPALGASALLDIGIYPITFAHLVLGTPDTISAAGTLTDRGIDVAGGATLTYASGAVASVSWNQTAATDSRASIAGDAGRIEIDAQFHHPDAFRLITATGEERVDLPRSGSGLFHEIVEVGACLRAGRTTSGVLTVDGTLEVLRTMDTIRRQLGVDHPRQALG